MRDDDDGVIRKAGCRTEGGREGRKEWVTGR